MKQTSSDVIAARAAHEAACVRKALADAPPLTDERAHRIAALLLADS